MRKIAVALGLLSAGLLAGSSAQAALHDRGRGLLYDDVLHLTWLQDASYAKTSGYATDGAMNWTAAKTWAENLDFGGYSDWRLASNTPVNGTPADWNFLLSYNGTSDWGYNITNFHSELSYMYYVNLGLKGYYSTSGTKQTDFGIFGDGTTSGQRDVGLVKNLQSGAYWSAANYLSNQAWAFHMNYGDQSGNMMWGGLYVWAVRAGDVAVVPEPETYALMLAGLGLIGGIARRRLKK